jgi:3-dehydroquinate dehydratase/shikimate dehydrogenase
MTRLCVAIFVTDEAQARRDMALAAERGADMVELRVDSLDDVSVLLRLLESKLLPAIVTCRPTWEGGHSTLSDADRGVVLTTAADAGAEFIDLEWETVRKNPAGVRQAVANRSNAGGRLIVSTHKFTKGRPARLFNLLLDVQQSVADIPKIVWRASSIRDNLEAFDLLRHAQKPTIALCMDEPGLISRVLAKKFGAFLTFAALDAASGTAPGQIAVADMKRLYRWDAITPQTKVYGVVGSPVGHSMSPAIHNAAFGAVGHDGVYLPLLVNPGYEIFKAFMESFLAFDGLHLSGLSVTIPHKENALRYLKERGADVEPLAERIGAVNTIAIDGATLRGTNTDYAAILDTITAALGIDRSGLAGMRVAVLGAGGTGRTAVAALASCGATVVVYNRTRDRADALAAEFDGTPGKVVAAHWDKLCASCCQVYVNTTSIGMSPDVDSSPFGDNPPPLSAESLVFDAVYNPPRTKLLRQAEAAGARTVGGVEMFVRQAAAQFTTWTGRDAPVGVMRSVVEARLRPAGG